jgi:transposase
VSRPRVLDDAAVKKVVAWYRHGDSIRTIADRTGASYGAVHKALTAAGVTMRPRGGNHR